jgi:hypothetical protein
MSKTQNRNMERKRRQGSTTPQKINNDIIEDLVESEGDEYPLTDIRKRMIRIFNELKSSLRRTYKNKSKKFNRT